MFVSFYCLLEMKFQYMFLLKIYYYYYYFGIVFAGTFGGDQFPVIIGEGALFNLFVCFLSFFLSFFVFLAIRRAFVSQLSFDTRFFCLYHK